MAHRAETTKNLSVIYEELTNIADHLQRGTFPQADVVFIGLPSMEFNPSDILNTRDSETAALLGRFAALISRLAQVLPVRGKLVLYGDTAVLCFVHPFVNSSLIYNIWIAVRTQISSTSKKALPTEHRSLVIYTKGDSVLRHAKTRIAYEYCPACNQTTKDYGGKKHLYPSYGTLMSDVWKDFAVDPKEATPHEVMERVCDMFSIGGNDTMLVLDGGNVNAWRRLAIQPSDLRTHASHFQPIRCRSVERSKLIDPLTSRLYNGDALELLTVLPTGAWTWRLLTHRTIFQSGIPAIGTTSISNGISSGAISGSKSMYASLSPEGAWWF